MATKTFVFPPVSVAVSTNGLATEANQQLELAQLTGIHSDTTSLDSKVKDGQQTMANSVSVVIASNQTPIPVIASFADPAEGTPGAAAPAIALQVAGSDGTNLRVVKVSATGLVSTDGSAVTQPISAASLPLPTGAATAANQATEISSLATIATNTTGVSTAANQTTANGSLATIATNTTGVATAANQTTEITKLTSIDGKLPSGLTVTATRLLVDSSGSTQPVSGTVVVTQPTAANLNATVTGSVSVSNFPATQPISATALPLPTGASTSALQTTGNTSLSSIDTKLVTTANGLKVDGSAVTQPVSGTFFQATQPVSLASSPLPTGAATAANQATEIASLATIATNTSSSPSDRTATGTIAALNANVQLLFGSTATAEVMISGTWVATMQFQLLQADGATWSNFAVAYPNTSGAAVASTAANGNWSIPTYGYKGVRVIATAFTSGTATVNINGSNATMFVKAIQDTAANLQTTAVIASGTVTTVSAVTAITNALPAGTNVIGFVKQGGKTSANAPARLDYTATSVTTAAFVQLVASTTTASTEIEIFDSSGQTLALATGASGSEVIQAYIFPGGNGRIPLAIAAAARVSIKAISATASVGEIDINFYN